MSTGFGGKHTYKFCASFVKQENNMEKWAVMSNTESHVSIMNHNSGS